MSRAVTVLSRYLYSPSLMLKSRTRNNSTGISFCLVLAPLTSMWHSVLQIVGELQRDW
jgi:hypothetical protein